LSTTEKVRSIMATTVGRRSIPPTRQPCTRYRQMAGSNAQTMEEHIGIKELIQPVTTPNLPSSKSRWRWIPVRLRPSTLEPTDFGRLRTRAIRGSFPAPDYLYQNLICFQRLRWRHQTASGFTQELVREPSSLQRTEGLTSLRQTLAYRIVS